MGISVAIIIVNNNSNKNTYTAEGMCLGMSFGLLLGTSFSSGHMGLFLSLGMLIGESLGMLIGVFYDNRNKLEKENIDDRN